MSNINVNGPYMLIMHSVWF